MRKKLSYEEVKHYIEVESQSGCKLVSEEYIDYHTSLIIRCSCGREFKREFCTFKGKKLYKCYECAGDFKPVTYGEIKKELNENGIELLSDSYENNKQKLKIKCENGHITERVINHIRRSNYTCPCCNKKGYKRDTEIFKKEVFEVSDGEYELLSEYKTMHDYVILKHHKCGYEWSVTPHNFLDYGQRCPNCKKSKGEQTIEQWFIDNKVTYACQYTFYDLKGDSNLLRFDFAIFDELNVLKCLIEFDGQFHYLPLRGQSELDKQQKYDNYKNEYCKNNNIPLIRIPYWEFDNINSILSNSYFIREVGA